jgi:hypothetical protein
MALISSIVGASIIAGGSAASGIIGSRASKKAAEIQAKAAEEIRQQALAAADKASGGVNAATEKANQLLQGLPKEVRDVLAPYLGAGEEGLASLKALMAPGGELSQKFAFTPDDLTKTPGYQFTLQQGEQAIQRAASAQGKNLGGGTLKSLMGYGQGLAGTTYQQEFGRAIDTFNTNRQGTALKLNAIMGLTGMGQDAAGSVANVTGTSGFQQAGNIINAGRYSGDTGLEAARIAAEAMAGGANAQAAGKIGSANAWSSAIGSGTNSFLDLIAMRPLMSGNFGTAKVKLPSYDSLGIPSGAVRLPPS